MHDALLRGAHDLGLRCLECCCCCYLVAGRDRLLDVAHGRAHARAARGVDFGAARDHACGFAGGGSIGHGLSVVSRALSAPEVQTGEKERAAKLSPPLAKLIGGPTAGVNAWNRPPKRPAWPAPRH